MAVTNPTIIPGPIVSSTGELTAAQQVILNDDTNAEDAISGKEDSLGNPTENGQVLQRDTDGTTTWVNPASASLPNQFLDEIVETDRDVYTRVEGGTAIVRFWLRDNEVTSLNVGNAGEGLLISESNGEFNDDEDQFRLGSNDFGARLYMSLDDTFIAATDLSTLRVRVFDGDGNEVENLNVATNFTNEGKFGTGGNNTFFQLTSGASAGSRLNYVADELIQLFASVNDPFFDIPEANEDNVDLTRAIKDIPETSLDIELQSKINSDDGVPFDDQFKLDKFRETLTESASAQLTGSTQFLAKKSTFSPDTEDYIALSFDTGLPPSISGTTRWIVAFPHQYDVTDFTGIDGSTNTVLIDNDVKLTPSSVNNNEDITYNIYSLTIPAAVSPTPTALTPTGSLKEITRIKPDSILKIGTDNLDQDLADLIHNGANMVGLSDGLIDLNNHITVDPITGGVWRPAANPVPINSTITRLFAAFWDENRTGSSRFLGNYFEDLPDPTTSFGNLFYYANPDDADNTRFPGKQSYQTSRLDIDSVAFGAGFQKLIGFSFYISDSQYASSAEFQAGIPILKFGTRRVIRIGPDGITATVGDLSGNPVNATFSERLTEPGAGSTIQYLQGVGTSATTWFVPENNPVGTAITFPLTLTARIKDVDLDTGTTASTVTTVEYTITDRAVSQAQSSQVVAINQAVGGGTRDETLLFEYNATTNVFTLSTAQLANNGPNEINKLGMEVTYNDSRDINSSVSTNEEAFSNQVTLIENEVSLAILIEAENPNETSADKNIRIKVVINGNQENDINMNLRASAYDFEDIQIGPNSGDKVAISNVQYYSWDDGGDPQNAIRHAQLYQMWLRRTDWYGQFQHPDFNSRTYTVDGELSIIDRDDNTQDVTALLKLLATPTTGDEGRVMVVNSGEDAYEIKELYRDITDTAIGANPNEHILTLPTDYGDFAQLQFTVIEDAGQTTNHVITIRNLVDNASIANIRISGNDTAVWNRTNRTLTTDSVTDHWVAAILAIPVV